MPLVPDSPIRDDQSVHATTTLPVDRAVATRWLNVVSHLDRKYGGLSAIVPQLCSSVDAVGTSSIELAAFCLPSEQFRLTDFPDVSTTYWPVSRTRWLIDKELHNSFYAAVDQVDGVHIHGLWEQSTYIAARAARTLGKPYLISAHGMLDRWALANKKWKKRVYATFSEHANVRRASCLHALTLTEAEDYRRFGATCPIAIIPNAVQIPSYVTSDAFLTAFPKLRGKRIVLFLGRIHFKKGLDILVRSWAKLAKQFPETSLVIAGPDSQGLRRSVEDLVNTQGIADQVLFTGMLDQKAKWSALAAADCFVLPSHSEGFSASVLEAMGMGLPVIVSRQCNIPDVLEFQAGWVIEPEVDDLTSALRWFLNTSSTSNNEMGERGRQLVRTRYNWRSVAGKMSVVYQWLAGGPRPQSVEMVN
jgi:glycosyltransferase involved in cell wall biosynthesis